MLKMTIDDENVVSNKDITIKEEMLGTSSTILNNVYPEEWEEDKDYVSRFYYPEDYSKLRIQNEVQTQEYEAGTTIQVNGSTTLTDVDTTKNSKVLRLLGQTSQTGTPTPSSPIPVNVVSGNNNIVVCGKNLININDINYQPNNVTITNEGEGKKYLVSSAGTWWQVPNYKINNILPSTQYTYSCDVIGISISQGRNARILVDQLDSSGNVISTSGSNHYIDITSTETYSKTLTTHSNTVSFLVRVYVEYAQSTANTYVILKNVMVEKSPIKTTYEPYIGNTYPINLGSIELCKIGTYQDYIYKDNGNWYKYSMVGKHILDGSENYTFVQRTGVNSFYNTDVYTSSIYKSNITINIISNYFEGIKDEDGNLANSIRSNNSGTLYITISNTNPISASDSAFKTWLASNNVTTYYRLATPTTTQITDTTLIEQLEALTSQ